MKVNKATLSGHDKIVTDMKLATLFSIWLSCHKFERIPRITKRRKSILIDFVQRYGYEQCSTVLRFLCSEDPHATWVRDNGYTLFDNIFNDIKWERRYKRAKLYFIEKGDK